MTLKKINLFLLVLISAFLNSCGGPDPVAGTATSASKTPTSSAEQGLAGTFYVMTYKGTSSSLYQTHKLVGGIAGDTDWTQPCSVSPSDFGTAAADIVCLAEGHELDLYFQGATVNAAAPTGYCDYVEEKPYYYFYYQPGVGNATPAYIATGNPSCSYDYTKAGGPNCCVGNWTMTGTAPNPDRSGNYGGSYGNCLMGPNLITSEFTKDIYGRPKSLMTNTALAGVSISRVIKSPINLGGGMASNIGIANYFKPSDHTHTSTYSPAADLFGGTTAPIAFDTQTDSYSGVSYRTNPFYTYICYDTNREIKARIRLMIRDWNLLTELHQGGDPNSNATLSNGDPENDFFDWKDFNDVSDTLFPKANN